MTPTNTNEFDQTWKNESKFLCLHFRSNMFFGVYSNNLIFEYFVFINVFNINFSYEMNIWKKNKYEKRKKMKMNTNNHFLS